MGRDDGKLILQLLGGNGMSSSIGTIRFGYFGVYQASVQIGSQAAPAQSHVRIRLVWASESHVKLYFKFYFKAFM